MPMLMLGVLIGAIAVVGAIFGLQLHPPTPSEIPMSYADLAAVMLGAVAVLVTILGVFVAILALWGYTQFKVLAQSAAINHVEEELKDGGKLRKFLTQRVDEILLTDAGVRDAASSNRSVVYETDEDFKG